MAERPLTVACVLRSGGIYRPEHVRQLRDSVARHLSGHTFVCLTDTLVHGVACIPLIHDWPGWWAKIELWRPGIFDARVLYLDLDTVAVGDLSDLAAYDGPFAMMNDLGKPEGATGTARLGASAVMAWQPTDRLSEDVYAAFARVADGAMAGRQISGDQNWIAGAVNGRWDDLRGLYPGQIVSWRLHCDGGVPDGARLVCWHGKDKPWNTGWTH